MPIEDGVGYGPLTSLKIQHLSSIFSMHLAITQAVLNKHKCFKQRYRYVDVTAGKGFSPDGLLMGSPLVFLEQVETDKFQCAYRADFIEKNDNHLEELKNNITDYTAKNGWLPKDWRFHPGDYQSVIPSLFDTEDKLELGLVFVDHSGDLPHFDTLSHLARVRPRMEVLFYLPTTNLKRLYSNTHKLLSDYMREVGKNFWLIRKPVRWDQHKWTFLLGSDTDIFKNYKKIDFLRIDSKEAQEFFPKLNLSTRQQRDSVQPPLFECE